MSIPLTGVNPTAYKGVTALTPANTFVHDRDPTIKDWQLYNLGDYWLNKVTYSLWYLANKGNNPPVGNPGVGIWKRIQTVEPVKALTYYLGANTTAPDLTGNGTVLVVKYNLALGTPTLTGYNPASGVFIAPEDGVYTVNSTISYEGIVAGMDTMRIDIALNGTGPDVGATGYPVLVTNAFNVTDVNTVYRYNFANTFRLNAGDIMNIQTSVSGGAQVVALSIGLFPPGDGPGATWLKITKIG